jgi:regulator of cell morphogenesis and NO signaling
MSNITITDTVGAIVARRPELSRVFEKAGIDYCCAGKITLEQACQRKTLGTEALLAALNAADSDAEGAGAGNPAAMTLAELADHIERTHHDFLREEFPRLDAMTNRVAHVHGEHEPRLLGVRDTFLALRAEMDSHMMKEEQILFPRIRQLEASTGTPAFPRGSLSGPIDQMEEEHGAAGSALERLSALTDGFVPPEWACNTYRAMLSALATLERDLHQHVHKENNILFPRALALEVQRREELVGT